MRFTKWGQNEHEVQLGFKEAQVSLLVGRNQPNKEIAALLHVSEISIAKCVRDLLRGLRLGNRGELGQWAMQHPEAFVGGQVDPHLEPLKIADMQLLKLLSETDASIASKLHLPEAHVTLRIADLMLLLHLVNRGTLQTWVKEHPTALQLGWSHTDLHPPNCDCGRPYCHLSSLLSSMLE
jgi:DNA-binding CsgD family transcriptional regulator